MQMVDGMKMPSGDAMRDATPMPHGWNVAEACGCCVVPVIPAKSAVVAAFVLHRPVVGSAAVAMVDGRVGWQRSSLLRRSDLIVLQTPLRV
jgi:hypothetical protein